LPKPLIYLGLLLGLGLVVELLWHVPLQQGGQAPPVQAGVLVVDALTGDPVPGARLARLDARGGDLGTPLEADDSGVVDVSVATPRLVRLTAEGYVPQVVAVGRPDDGVAGGPPLDRPQVVTISPTSATSVSLRVAGQVMMGGGLFQPISSSVGPVLDDPADGAAHAAVLTAVGPLLADADLSLATIGAPLVSDPDTSAPDPVSPGSAAAGEGSAPVTASTATAGALADAGIDVVSLANSHLGDAGSDGVDQTVTALDEVGVAHFGAGATEEQAWTPAVLDVRGRTVAFVGCSDIDVTGPDGQQIPFEPGPAPCTVDRLRQEVAEAAAQADDVVVALDAGTTRSGEPEYDADADQRARDLAETAAAAGASLVVDSRSHQPRGVVSLDGVPWALGTGDLVDDNTTWATLPATLLHAVLDGGTVTTASLDPLAMIHYRPVPVSGSLADSIARQVTAEPGGILGLGDRRAGWPAASPTGESVDGDAGVIVRLGTAQTLDAAAAPARVGRDLLWGTGSMEDLETDLAAPGSTLWALGRYVTTSMESTCSGVQGLRLRRGPLSEKDVVISPQYREPVVPGTRLTLTANVRLASEGASLEVRWYRTLDPTKRSSGAQSVAITPHRLSGPCAPVSLDLTVPPDMVAVQPFIRLSPRHDVNLAAELRVDDVRLVAWSDATVSATATGFGPLLDTVELPDSGSVPVSRLRW
jgi:poly-gamma-glutamate synthesis protein (capsule biosynthesis protein)